MYFRILVCGFLLTTVWSSVDGGCEFSERVDGCTYTVHCIGNAGSVYTSGCDEGPNVTFVMEAANVRVISLGFFSRTNFDQRVRYFIGINNNWDVIEPNTFKYYRKSVSLDLFQNRIIEIKDGAFNELVMMKHLNLSDNLITQLHDKSLQISIVSQNSLEVLDLSKNLLTSVENNVFSNLANLKILLLNDNQITTLETNCFSILRHLTHLTLNKNKISSLNLTLTAMSELKYLDLSRNEISKLSGIDMLRLVSLMHFNVSRNAIESVSYNCFAQAFSLQTVDLSYNRIATPIEKEMFNYNSNLTYLNLYHNNITTLGDSVFKTTKLSYLNIENNNIIGDITNDTFSGLYKITDLNLMNQHIKALRNNAFTDMTKLRKLDLSHNNISIVENASFVNASELIVLNLSYNYITDLEFFRQFSSNLTDVLINNNNISFVPEYIFSNHSSLTTLDLSENVIKAIEPNSLSLYSIQYLYLKGNNISGTLVNGVLSPARLLKKLDLSYHNFKAINDSALVDLPLLETLNISHNNIQYIDSNNFRGVDNLYSLDISSNNLTTLNINGKLGQLTELFLKENRLKCIPNLFRFVNASKLLRLDFSHNNISNVTYPGFEKLTHLIELNLSHNNISNINNPYTNMLAMLTDLDLESNHIKEINLTYFQNIRHVNLMDNDISYFNDSQFRNLNNLSILNIRTNKIQVILPGTFQHLSSLRSLILSDNNITNLRFGTFRGLNQTNTIDLSHNKIQTINVDVFHECYELRNLVIDYNNITSVDIERLVEVSPNLELISLGGNPIACEEIVRSSNKRFNDRHVEITSMHKIYHEDNVHGIKCGDNDKNSTVEVVTDNIKTPSTTKPESVEGISSSTLLVIWCAIISVLVVVGLGFIYWRHRNFTISNDTTMQYHNNSSSRNSECYSDLLN